MNRATYDDERTTVFEVSRWFTTVRVISADSPISTSEVRANWGRIAGDVAAFAGSVGLLVFAALWAALM